MAKRNSSDREKQQRLRTYQARQTVHETRVARRRRDNILWAVIGVVVIAGAILAQVAYSGIGPAAAPTASPSASASPGATAEPSASAEPGAFPSPDPAAAEGRAWTGTLVLNDDVTLDVELDGAAAPTAVASTISLANGGFYDGVPCHRITVTGIFVLQCGDPTGTGTGGPGYSYGPVENAPADDVYPAGTIAMARQGNNGDSMGSQFFIVYEDSTIPSDSAGGYTVLGRVTAGLDALRSAITDAGLDPADPNGVAPLVPTSITGFTLQ